MNSRLLTCLTVAAVASAANAQPVQITYEDGLAKMTSTTSGRVLLDPRGLSRHDGGPLEDVVEPEIEVVEHPDGFDQIYTFTNTSNVAKPLGRLKVGVISIGEDVTYRDFRWGGHELPANANSFGGMSVRYPLSLYSPVHVIATDDYAVGVSLQYPVMEYKHDITLSMVSPGGAKADGPGGRGWMVVYKMNHWGTEHDGIKMSYTAWLEPGETQTYTVSVRATNNPDEWIRTLVPYRKYFHQLYGGVRYERDPRAILGFMSATSNEITEENPEGWTSPKKLRPDEKGWQPWMDWMFEREGWERMMLWMSGGTYTYDRDQPFDFVRNWEGNPNLMEAVDPVLGFQQIEDKGRTFGLWWSQSVNYSESWGNLVGFDMNNPVQVEAFLAELDLAVSTGCTMIGLDTFSHKNLAMWDQYKWLQFMQQRYPHVTYVVEPLTMDFMHTLAPAHYTGHDDLNEIPEKLEDIWMFHSPHYLADFINPGHEIWGAWRYWAYQFFGVEWTKEMALEDIQIIADLGYVPLLFTGRDIDLPHDFDGAETWWETVPEDLMYFAPPFEENIGNDQEGAFGDGFGNGGGNDGDDGEGDGGDQGGDGGGGQKDDDGAYTFAQFQMLFKAGDMRADCNGDGTLSILDYVCFQERQGPKVLTFVNDGDDGDMDNAAMPQQPGRGGAGAGRMAFVPTVPGVQPAVDPTTGPRVPSVRDGVRSMNTPAYRAAVRAARSERPDRRISVFGPSRAKLIRRAPVVRLTDDDD